MRFEVYCDESHPDAFFSEADGSARYLMIGGLWLPSDIRAELKGQLNRLKQEHSFTTEIKWHKVHSAKEAFYMDLIKLFFSYGEQLRFRCIAVDSQRVDMVKFHKNDKELGFYKFYYQMLQHWIDDFNEYSIFCDEKSNRARDRLRTLHTALCNSNLSSKILWVQALPSKEVVLIQFADFLLGMASSRMNDAVRAGSVKERLIQTVERKLDRACLTHTPKSERKFNIFKIRLEGGW